MIGRVLVSIVVAAMITWCMFWAFGALMYPDPGLGPAPVRNTSSFGEVKTIEPPQMIHCSAWDYPGDIAPLTSVEYGSRAPETQFPLPSYTAPGVHHNLPEFDRRSADIPEPEPPD